MAQQQPSEPLFDPESAVRARYDEAARRREEALCCPVDYDPKLLEVIPSEVLERDYGCGDPSPFVREGDRVLDLGSGGGKLVFMAAQLAGPKGHVLGVDGSTQMLALARRAQGTVAARLGYENVAFRRGRIQDLALDLEALGEWLREHPVRDPEGLQALEAHCARLRREAPLVADASVDLVISNCVLNLVRLEDRRRLVGEIARVLAPGGRAAISDIVSDAPVPGHLREDPELWSGCVSGAFEERELLEALAAAGLEGLRLEKRESRPFAEVEGIRFRAVTVTGRKPPQVRDGDEARSLIYRGPWRRVEDDRGNALVRGEATPVDAGSFASLTAPPFSGETFAVGGAEACAPEAAGCGPSPSGDEGASGGGCC